MSTSAVVITCGCKTCKISADKIGAAFPMVATVNDKFAAMLGNDKKAIHNTVHDYNHPTLGAETRRMVS